MAADTTPLSPDFGSDGGTKRMWVADFGAPGISAVQLDQNEPRFYALAPMSWQPESGNVGIGEYDHPASCTLGPASSKASGSVDVGA